MFNASFDEGNGPFRVVYNEYSNSRDVMFTFTRVQGEK